VEIGPGSAEPFTLIFGEKMMLFDWGVLIKGIDVEGRLETLLGMLHGANDDRSLYLSRNTRALKKKC